MCEGEFRGRIRRRVERVEHGESVKVKLTTILNGINDYIVHQGGEEKNVVK